MKNKLILVSGTIGAGKTTFIKKLTKELGWASSNESVFDNPYLDKFYSDPSKWSYHLQTYILGIVAKQHKELSETPNYVLLDRGIYDAANVFVRSLYEQNIMTKEEFNSYFALYDLIIPTLKKPDLVIYIECNIETALKRIKKRGIECEQSIDYNYLNLLEKHYNNWITSYNDSPILYIDSEKTNFVKHNNIVETFSPKIIEALEIKNQPQNYYTLWNK